VLRSLVTGKEFPRELPLGQNLLSAYAEIIPVFLLGTKAAYAFLSKLLPQLLSVTASDLAAFFHVVYYFLCLLVAVASTEEIDYVGVIVG